MTTSSGRDITYEPPGPVALRFMQDPSFVRGVMGPIGSGKSTACVLEILSRAQEQNPGPDGIRRTRWAIIRNSYPELKSTTIKTWGEWCPLSYGKTNFDSPIIHHVKTPELDMEVLFLALDRDDDVRKLLSLELTGAWINEAREVPKAIVDALTGRVGRYPPMKDGGPTWSGILMDTNPPDDQHWWYALAEESTPDGWEFFRQPGGRTKEAENRKNLIPNYYDRVSAGKDPDWVKVYVDGQYGYVVEGKAVYPMFRDSTHVSPTVLKPNPAFPLLLGADFGLTPAAVLGQKLPDGRWQIVDEFVTDNSGIVRFAQSLATYVASVYPDFQVGECYGDPAGDARGNDERTAFELMREHTSWVWKPAPTNDIPTRIEVVIGALNRMVDGQPGFLLSPACKILRKGFSGGYHYAPIRTANGTMFHDQPKKNEHSHPHDGLQYLFLGGGEYQVITNKIRRQKRAGVSRVPRDKDYDIFASSDLDATDG